VVGKRLGQLRLVFLDLGKAWLLVFGQFGALYFS
jgi:hypothetical protein